MIQYLIILSFLINFINGLEPKLILISFDGFRSDYLHPELTPTMFKLAKEGVSSRVMKSCYVTKTFPNHFSISTGLYEENHGIVGNYIFDPILNDTFDDKDQKWWVNNTIKPIWILNQQLNKKRNSGSIMWPGTLVKFDNQLAKYVQKYDKTISLNEIINTAIDWMTNDNDKANFLLIYIDKPDIISHDYGPFSPEVKNILRVLDHTINQLINKLDEYFLLEKTNFIILSDHGMSETNINKLIKLEDIIDENEVDFYNSSPVLNVKVKNSSNIDKVYNTLKSKAFENHFTVYKKENIPKVYHYGNNRRVLDILIEANEGYELISNLSLFLKKKIKKNLSNLDSKDFNFETMNIIDKFKKRSILTNMDYWGNHGYNNSLSSMKPLFFAFGPAFKKNYIHRKPFLNIDVYSLMCLVLELDLNYDNKFCIQDGEPNRIINMLKDSTKFINDNYKYSSYIEKR